MATLKYWLWLTGRKEIRPGQILAVLDHFGTPEHAYYADPEEYALVEGLSPGAREDLKQKELDGAEKILEQCDRLGISLLTIQDAQYPNCLKNIKDPPPLLYYRGRLPAFDETLSIGVVGARKCTAYGELTAARLSMGLARAGTIVVSGIAQGIDSRAVKGALAGGGTVVSVLGCGIDVKYPPSSRYLYDDVAAAGALISEYPPGTPPLGEHFPVRNRILSGLSDGVAAVEAAMRSGTLITMNLALEQGRDTFAVPGPVNAPMSMGTNRLIRDGCAKLILDARDILVEYESRYPAQLKRPLSAEAEAARLAQVTSPDRAEEKKVPSSTKKEVDRTEERAYIDWKSAKEEFTDDERDLLLALQNGPRVADELIEQTQIPAKRVLSALTVLQVRGFVGEDPGRRFRALALLRAEVDR